uniref:hypothetical protein n=1 Tax=Candidatus Albibeggiatoa sp. nov. BB20 TaxID=3162723 RepID=UPI0033659076
MKQLISLLLMCFAFNVYADDLPFLETVEVYKDSTSNNENAFFIDSSLAKIQGGILSEDSSLFPIFGEIYPAGGGHTVVYQFKPDTPMELRFNIKPELDDIDKIARIFILATYTSMENILELIRISNSLENNDLEYQASELAFIQDYTITPTGVIPLNNNKLNESLYP